ncbi:MAG: hypothetical protein ACFWUE_10540 [Xylanivirga thermophila]|jgi:sucrose 6(F)-phosphate phosphorylase
MITMHIWRLELFSSSLQELPQVYYVGALAGANDYESLKNNTDSHAINRHNYSINEIDEEINREVVKRLFKLIRFKNKYPSFNGEFKVLNCTKDKVRLSWQNDDKRCTLFIDLNTNKSIIDYINEDGNNIQYLI